MHCKYVHSNTAKDIKLWKFILQYLSTVFHCIFLMSAGLHKNIDIPFTVNITIGSN